jgi:hypothetical protein
MVVVVCWPLVRVVEHVPGGTRGRAEKGTGSCAKSTRPSCQGREPGRPEKQREQVLQYVTQLEKQLPSKAEMDALLSDINQAGTGAQPAVRSVPSRAGAVSDYYAELPITLRVTGRYHDMGAFACRHCQPVADRDAQQHHHSCRGPMAPSHGCHCEDLPLPGCRGSGCPARRGQGGEKMMYFQRYLFASLSPLLLICMCWRFRRRVARLDDRAEEPDFPQA